MKKFLGIVSAGVTSIVMSVCLPIPCITYSALGNDVKTYSGWQILSGKTTILGVETSTAFSTLDNYSFMKVALIIMLVLGILLALLTIVMLLQQTNVIKTKIDFNFINVLLLIAFVVCAIILLILVAKFNKEISASENMYYASNIGFILNLVVSTVMLCGGIYAIIPSKKKKSRKK